MKSWYFILSLSITHSSLSGNGAAKYVWDVGIYLLLIDLAIIGLNLIGTGQGSLQAWLVQAKEAKHFSAQDVPESY